METAPVQPRSAAEGCRFLLQHQNPDGGWPYKPGNPSSPEPTCWSLLAVQDSDASRKAAAWLLVQRNVDGAIMLPGDDQPHWSTALAVLALKGRGESAFVTSAIHWLLNWKGRVLDQPGIVRVDGHLVGWPWASDTFSWVEPTCYALLAIKSLGGEVASHPRVGEAHRLLLDRACVGGGWNYGNPVVNNSNLPAWLPTTALACLALQDVETARPVVLSSLDFLSREMQTHKSALSLAWAILCFNVFQRPTEALAKALLARQNSDGSWRGQVHLTALSALALQVASGGPNPFVIGRSKRI